MIGIVLLESDDHFFKLRVITTHVLPINLFKESIKIHS